LKNFIVFIISFLVTRIIFIYVVLLG
jgi:hypothetical protein